MKGTTTMLIFAAALFCAAGARAQENAPSADPGQTPAAPEQTAPKSKEQRKMAWENGVKTDCAAEIGAGGVCEGKDFSTGLVKCLHQNRKKLSDGCMAAVHPRKRARKEKKEKMRSSGAVPPNSQEAPASAPAQAPTNP